MVRLLVIILAVSTACAPSEPHAVVLVASSLSGVVQPFVDERANVRLISGASDALVWQLDQGAPAVAFLSADEQPIAALGTRALDVTVVACDALALWTSTPVPLGESVVETMRRAERFGMVDENVPLGRRTQEVLQQLRDQGYTDVAANVTMKAVSRDSSARQLAARVRLGELDAAIGYASLANRLDGLYATPLPAGVGVPVSYRLVRLDDTSESLEIFEALGAYLARLDGSGLVAPSAGRCELAR